MEITFPEPRLAAISRNLKKEEDVARDLETDVFWSYTWVVCADSYDGGLR